MHFRGANEPTRVGREETLGGNQLEDDEVHGCIVIRCWINKLRINCDSEFYIYWTVVKHYSLFTLDTMHKMGHN